MVFDWFRRRTAPQAETAAETPAEQALGSDSDMEAVDPGAWDAVIAAVVPEVASAPPQGAPGEAVSTPLEPAPAAAGGVDQEALEWARQA
jgi:hypothetical protein